MLADEASSSSPKKLFIADIAGLNPAMANGVNNNDGINGAENSKPKPSGFDNKLLASPPTACLSTLALFLLNKLVIKFDDDDDDDDVADADGDAASPCSPDFFELAMAAELNKLIILPDALDSNAPPSPIAGEAERECDI